MENLFNMPKISFVVVSHNFEDYILDCLNSIKNQDYQNLELVIVDDLSTDKTVERIEEFCVQNHGLTIKFVKNEKNIGQLASFLRGLKEVDGEFVAQIDGDDVLFRDYAKVHIEAHLKTSVALTSCKHIDVDAKNVVHTFESIDCPQESKQGFNLFEEKESELKSSFVKERESDYDVKILPNDKYNFATWHWAPTSSGVMRKSVCDLLLKLKNPQKVKITSDKFVFSFAHLIGSSAIIQKTLYAYRKHNSNYSLANPVMGSKRYLKTKTQSNYIRNNRLIRQEMFKFVAGNYPYFVERFNRAEVMRILKKIVFSFDINTLKSVIKSLFI